MRAPARLAGFLAKGFCMDNTFLRSPKSVLALTFAGVFAFCFGIPSSAWAERDGFKQGEEQQVSRKKKYLHLCPPGTEPVGKAPQEGGTQVFCRQPVVGGYVKQGLAVTWHENGQKHFEGEYYGDKKHGKWVTFDRNGRRKAQEEWFNGKLVKKAQYDKNGTVIEKPDRNALRDKKKKENSWRDELRTKVEKKKASYHDPWVKRTNRSSRNSIF